MAFEVNCPKCSARFTLPDDLFERKVKGRVVTVRCRKCQSDISVNGMQLGGKPSSEKPTLDLTPTARLPKATDLTPTVPVTRVEPKPKQSAPYEGLWLVSYGDDDDRELSVAQIQKALLKGEIDGQTIVWNSRMDDWKPLAELPELAGKTDAVGGFLGTGSQVTTVLREPALRDSNAPALVPGKEENDILGEDELGPFRAVGAGTLGFDDDAPPVSVEPISLQPASLEPIVSADFKKPEPPRVTLGKPVVGAAKPEPKLPEAKKAEQKKPPPPRREAPKPEAGQSEAPTSNPPPKPKVLPQAPKRLQPDWLSEAKPEDDEAPPSSQGTPNLKDLTIFAPKPVAEEVPAKKPTEAEDDLLGVGGGGLMAGIDLSNLPPPPVSSRPPPAVDAPSDSQPPRSRRSRSKRPPSERTKSDRPEARARSERPVTKLEEKTEKKDSKSLGMIWLVAAGLGIVGVWWLFFRPPSDRPTNAATSAQSEPTPARTVESPKPENTREAVPPPTAGDGDASAPNSRPEATTKEPTEKKEPVASTEPTEKKEPVASTKEPTEKKEPVASTKKEEPADVDMAPPFDKAAASAALNSAAGAASSCRQAGDPSGTATVVVTFAPSGRATNANLTGPPFAGTATGGCIAAAMRRAKIPAFSGSHMTVSKTVVIQ